MKSRKHKKIITFLKFIPLLACIVFVILFLASGRDVTVQDVLNYTPENPFAAAMVILILYALKRILRFPHCRPPDCNRASFPDACCPAGQFRGKGSHSFHPLLDWPLFRC